MKLSRGQSGRVGIPMPLWLQGVLEALQLALLSAVPLLVAIVAVYLTVGFGSPAWDLLARLTGQGWLLMHGVPLTVSLTIGETSAQQQSGVLSLIPLGLVLIPFFLARRAGGRLARAAYTDQLWQPMLSSAVVYAVVGLTTGYVCRTAEASAPLPLAALVPLIPVLAGLMVGVRREAGSWSPMIGQAGAEHLASWGQVSRWTGSYLWAAFRAAFVSVLAAVALSAALLAINVAVHWADIVAAYQGLRAGSVGGAVLTLIQGGFLPNLAIWTMAWAAGPGFALGAGSSVGPLATQVAPIPAIPMLAALPVGQLSWGVLALVIPVLAGVLGGWWFLREGENHLEDWFSLKVSPRWLSTGLSTVCLGVGIGVLTGAMAAGFAWLSRGSLGIGRLTEIGPDPLATAVWIAVEVALGVMIGHTAAPWLEGMRLRRRDHGAFDPFAGRDLG